MLTSICTMVGAYVISTKVVVPIMEKIDDKTKFTDTVGYALCRASRKVGKVFSKKDRK